MRFNCYEDNEERLSDVELAGMPQDANSSATAIEDAWTTSTGLVDKCRSQSKNIGSLIGTASVAHDILRINDALNQGLLINFYGE